MARECLAFIEKGVRAFKPKIGADPDKDADRLRAIREAVGPEVSFRTDANQGYNPKEAIRLCRLAERAGVGLELLEQPVPAWDLDGMAFVRRAVDTPIEADESCYSVQDAMQIVRHEAADNRGCGRPRGETDRARESRGSGAASGRRRRRRTRARRQPRWSAREADGEGRVACRAGAGATAGTLLAKGARARRRRATRLLIPAETG